MRLYSIVPAALLLASCWASKPEPVALPHVNGNPYRVWLRTYQDGAYADQPFELFVRSKSSKITKRVLFAEQCKDVSVAQTRDTLYVFYDALALGGFNSFHYGDEPRVRLCDLHFADCVKAERQLALAGTKVSNVCTYRTKRG